MEIPVVEDPGEVSIRELIREPSPEIEPEGPPTRWDRVAEKVVDLIAERPEILGLMGIQVEAPTQLPALPAQIQSSRDQIASYESMVKLAPAGLIQRRVLTALATLHAGVQATAPDDLKKLLVGILADADDRDAERIQGLLARLQADAEPVAVVRGG